MVTPQWYGPGSLLLSSNARHSSCSGTNRGHVAAAAGRNDAEAAREAGGVPGVRWQTCLAALSVRPPGHAVPRFAAGGRISLTQHHARAQNEVKGKTQTCELR